MSDLKTCCADAYGSDAVRLLLGDSYHPGGLELTRRLAESLGLTAGQRVLDVASGRGVTALLLADRYACRVGGVDYSPVNTARAREAAAAVGLAASTAFVVADAERLPHPDGALDAVVCECALCTFPDQRRAAAEFARVLAPGGVLGLTDVTADRDRLPPELTTLAARIACVADALPLDGYVALLADAGLRLERTERHDAALVRMIDRIEARLALLRLTDAGLDLTDAAPVLSAARTAVADGVLGYALLVARKPT